MGFRDILANGVALADKLTMDLQATVSWEPWLGDNGFGEHVYGPMSLIPAIVELKQQVVKNPSGEEVMSSHTVTFLRELPSLPVDHRHNPVDTRDRIVLSDGTKGIIVSVGGFQDSKTQGTYFTQVWFAAS